MSLVTGIPADSRDRRGCDRRIRVKVVHMEQTGAGDHVTRHVGGVERQPFIALPEHGAIAGSFVHQNQCVTMAGAPRNEVGGVDAMLL